MINDLSLPTNKTKLISIFTVITFLGALAGGAYGFAINQKEITGTKFTISQALAFGNKYIMVIGFIFSFIGIMLLNYLRKGKLLYIRYLLITIVFSLLLAIIWETTYKNEKLHYKLAGVIFLADLLFILLINYLYHCYLVNDKIIHSAILDLTIIGAYTAFIMLVVFGIFAEDTKTDEEDRFFAANELAVALLTLVPIYFLGFV